MSMSSSQDGTKNNNINNKQYMQNNNQYGNTSFLQSLEQQSNLGNEDNNKNLQKFQQRFKNNQDDKFYFYEPQIRPQETFFCYSKVEDMGQQIKQEDNQDEDLQGQQNFRQILEGCFLKNQQDMKLLGNLSGEVKFEISAQYTGDNELINYNLNQHRNSNINSLADQQVVSPQHQEFDDSQNISQEQMGDDLDFSQFQEYNYQKGEKIFENGRVYEGLDLVTGKHLAIKTFTKIERENLIIDQEKLQDLMILQRAMSDKFCQYIVFVEQAEGQLDILMERIAGNSLENIMEKFKTFQPSLIRQYVTQILQALQELHQDQMIHGNLKASNILFDLNGTIKLTDVNIFELNFTNINLLRNTCSAPELLLDNQLYYTSDIWSLGILIIQMSCGSTPWINQEGNPLSIENIVTQLKHKHMFQLPNYISRKLRKFLKMIFILDPLQRPTASQLLKDEYITCPDEETDYSNQMLENRQIDKIKQMSLQPAQFSQIQNSVQFSIKRNKKSGKGTMKYSAEDKGIFRSKQFGHVITSQYNIMDTPPIKQKAHLNDTSSVILQNQPSENGTNNNNNNNNNRVLQTKLKTLAYQAPQNYHMDNVAASHFNIKQFLEEGYVKSFDRGSQVSQNNQNNAIQTEKKRNEWKKKVYEEVELEMSSSKVSKVSVKDQRSVSVALGMKGNRILQFKQQSLKFEGKRANQNQNSGNILGNLNNLQNSQKANSMLFNSNKRATGPVLTKEKFQENNQGHRNGSLTNNNNKNNNNILSEEELRKQEENRKRQEIEERMMKDILFDQDSSSEEEELNPSLVMKEKVENHKLQQNQQKQQQQNSEDNDSVQLISLRSNNYPKLSKSVEKYMENNSSFFVQNQNQNQNQIQSNQLFEFNSESEQGLIKTESKNVINKMKSDINSQNDLVQSSQQQEDQFLDGAYQPIYHFEPQNQVFEQDEQGDYQQNRDQLNFTQQQQQQQQQQNLNYLSTNFQSQKLHLAPDFENRSYTKFGLDQIQEVENDASPMRKKNKNLQLNVQEETFQNVYTDQQQLTNNKPENGENSAQSKSYSNNTNTKQRTQNKFFGPKFSIIKSVTEPSESMDIFKSRNVQKDSRALVDAFSDEKMSIQEYSVTQLSSPNVQGLSPQVYFNQNQNYKKDSISIRLGNKLISPKSSCAQSLFFSNNNLKNQQLQQQQFIQNRVGINLNNQKQLAVQGDKNNECELEDNLNSHINLENEGNQLENIQYDSQEENLSSFEEMNEHKEIKNSGIKYNKSYQEEYNLNKVFGQGFNNVNNNNNSNNSSNIQSNNINSFLNITVNNLNVNNMSASKRKKSSIENNELKMSNSGVKNQKKKEKKGNKENDLLISEDLDFFNKMSQNQKGEGQDWDLQQQTKEISKYVSKMQKNNLSNYQLQQNNNQEVKKQNKENQTNKGENWFSFNQININQGSKGSKESRSTQNNIHSNQELVEK
ncbi:Protein kinase-like domain [Pseudocohnilembus persalinus]|uniref:Protein kinase-like domain n=1 Tax=Pseudocohnilembus persalinus TaxID=266149 RepID=A0A0V0R7Y5_PSEPJ|nr:Protein kinase-like domain [Pseudocohnilembus persalinus]|eukprot:KRX10595.1 Protein kinase-like domain [Pseudocohnilembus persalinus]